MTRLGLEIESVSGFIAELTRAAGAAARELGMDTREVSTSAEESEVDVLLVVGSVNLYRDLVARQRRTRRVLWHLEPLPKPVGGPIDRLHRALPTGKLLDLGGAALPPVRRTGAWRRWREEAANVREPMTNLVWLRRHAAAIDRIVIDTAARAEGALDSGISFEVVPFGYHASYAGPLTAPAAERDIGVLTLANISPLARRHRLVAGLADELRASNIELVRVPDHTYGADRRAILERTRVVVDVHRLPGSHPLFRFILSAAAGAAMISEPMAQPAPLVPGVHYVEAATKDLSHAAVELLGDEPRRRRIVEAAQALLATDLDLRRTLPRALG
jgi:hypothetical protein